MIGTIGSLVQVTTNRKPWVGALGLYTLGMLGIAVVLGGLLGGLGSLFGSLLPLAGRNLAAILARGILLLVALLAIAYALSDWGWLRMPRPYLLYAVPITWWRRWRPYSAALLYGAVLGLGLTTAMPFGAMYLIWLWAVVHASPLYGAALLGTYALARALTLIPISRFVYRRIGSSEDRLNVVMQRLVPTRDLLAALLVFCGTILVTMMLWR